jgi:hypothetical protein
MARPSYVILVERIKKEWSSVRGDYYATRFLAIEYSGSFDELLIIASDASFADDVGPQDVSGYVSKLFGGPIEWKATKQNTVATSTTEAELLALEHTAKETYALERVEMSSRLPAMSVVFGNHYRP